MNVISITYQSANCYLISYDDGWIMIDTCWPDTFSQLLQLLNQNNIAVNEINYLIITHYHPAHAGLTQNLKDLGTNLILHERQSSYYNRLNLIYKKNPQAHFRDITAANNIVLTDAESRSFFKSLGIDGELISTPGHSADSISFVVDHTCAFIGDLLPLPLPDSQRDIVIEDSWDFIRQFGVNMVYPGHGEPYELPKI